MGLDSELFEHPVYPMFNNLGGNVSAWLKIFTQVQGYFQSELVGFLLEEETEFRVVDVLLARRIIR